MNATHRGWHWTSCWLGGLAACLWLLLYATGGGQESADRLQQLRQRLPGADLNKDGKLTREELLQFKGRIRVPAADPAAPAVAKAARATGTVEIRITSNKPTRINPKIYGINCAEMFIFDLVQKPEYLAALEELQFHTYLFPGGSSYHHPTGSGGFNIREADIAKSRHGTEHRANKVGSPDFFEQYVAFMKQFGGHSVFIPNVVNGTVDELDFYLRKMTEAQVPVECVVLGMEVQLGAFRFETSGAYIAAIKPYVGFLKAKYPTVRVVGWSTPVGRRATVPAAYRQWNNDVANLPGIDGFAQYGWTEFGGAAVRGRGANAAASTPQQRLHEYDAFVEHFPDRQIAVYAEDWGKDKKMFLLQWGTHADRNLVVEGLHTVNFLFFLTEYNAQHDNYFEVATWSIPLMQDLGSGKRKNSGGGVLYKEEIALWSPYLYAKPLRHFYSGDRSLLATSVAGVENDDTMEVIKAISAAGPDGSKYLCILNRGHAAALGRIMIDGKAVSSDTSVRVESVSGDTLSTTGGALKTFAGNKMLGSLSIEPYSVTTLILP